MASRRAEIRVGRSHSYPLRRTLRRASVPPLIIFCVADCPALSLNAAQSALLLRMYLVDSGRMARTAQTLKRATSIDTTSCSASKGSV